MSVGCLAAARLWEAVAASIDRAAQQAWCSSHDVALALHQAAGESARQLPHAFRKALSRSKWLSTGNHNHRHDALVDRGPKANVAAFDTSPGEQHETRNFTASLFSLSWNTAALWNWPLHPLGGLMICEIIDHCLQSRDLQHAALVTMILSQGGLLQVRELTSALLR
jgi:hypothetical protein